MTRIRMLTNRDLWLMPFGGGAAGAGYGAIKIAVQSPEITGLLPYGLAFGALFGIFVGGVAGVGGWLSLRWPSRVATVLFSAGGAVIAWLSIIAWSLMTTTSRIDIDTWIVAILSVALIGIYTAIVSNREAVRHAATKVGH